MLKHCQQIVSNSLITKYSLVLVLITLCLPLFASQPNNIRESEIKAVYLYNFSLFTSWPASVLSPNSQFNLCVLGRDPFGRKLDIAVTGETVKKHPVTVRRILHYQNIDFCHTLYISESEKTNLDNIFNYLKGKPVLTVSDIKGFTSSGGMIEFYRRKTKVHFLVVPSAAVDNGLKISSQLLRVAKVIEN